MKRWKIWSLDIENALLQTDGSGREVCVRDPYEWKSAGAFRFWKSEAAAFGLNDAQAAFHRPLRRYLANSAEPRPRVGLRFEAPSFDPRPAFVLRRSGGAVGAIAARIDILGCGEALLVEGPGEALCARGRGFCPGGRFPCDADSGGLYDEPECHPRVSEVASRSGGSPVDC